MEKNYFCQKFELRTAEESGDEMIVEGTAIKFDAPNLLYDDGETRYWETVKKGACSDVDFSHTILRYNHDDSVPALASCRNGSLAVTVTDSELSIRAKLMNTQAARDIFELVRSGAAGGLSICFLASAEHYGGESGGTIRYIDKIDEMPEISIVDFPAYGENTSIEAVKRSAEKINRLKQKRRELVKKLYFE